MVVSALLREGWAVMDWADYIFVWILSMAAYAYGHTTGRRAGRREECVRAVNAHDALVAALEAVQADSTIETCPHCLKLANAALALAKGADRD